TNGKSLQKGLENCLADIQKGRISTTDESAFQVGNNIAATPGSVIYENSIMQLIQYQPTTPMVSQRPILMVPPCVNKYYILDLQRHNSLIRYCLDQGHQVFCMSWINPGTGQGALSWEDYLRQGVLTAMDIAGDVAGSDKIHTLGWCIGGTLLATALAVRNNNGKKSDISSATFITTMLDFSDPGDLGIFLNEIPEEAVALSENTGVIPGEFCYAFFSLIKADQLIWPYLISNYLKGETPAAFDFLYWNSDSTNLPAGLYMDFIRQFYKQNALIKPGGLTLCGIPIDLGKINTPSYFLSTVDDHIIPWQATLPNTRLFSGHTEFVLGSSGHVAGVINPPDPTRRNHWINGETGSGPAHWLNTATPVDGSWWMHWLDWLKKWDGKKVAAPKNPGNDTYQIIEPAPGRYVKSRTNLWNPDAAPHE
ncbi:MAG: alpha/beta fold hydrolase, partial [Deltaproteobacteria bacterium]|nr:alpha/beta fold hydrolase [Deltaproteobacteria bacterium]